MYNIHITYDNTSYLKSWYSSIQTKNLQIFLMVDKLNVIVWNIYLIGIIIIYCFILSVFTLYQ